MPRYEFTEGTSSKFWQIELDGSSFSTTYGRIGTSGATSMKNWKDDATAKKEYDKLIAEKTKKGYSLVGGAPKAKGKAAAAAPAAAPKKVATKVATKKAAATNGAAAKPAASSGKKNAALEKAIDASPENDDAWSVYGDWLTEQGDPRGELAAVQLRLAADPKNKDLLNAEKKLLKDHESALVGDLAKWMFRKGTKQLPSITIKAPLGPDGRTDDFNSTAPPFKHVGWRAGFVVDAFIGHVGYDYEGPRGDDEDGGGGGIDPAKIINQLMSSATGRFLTSLHVGLAQDAEDGECDYGDIVKMLVKNEGTARLRNLFLGDIGRDEQEVSWIDIGDISKLLAKASKLQTLTLRGSQSLKLGSINLPALRELTIITGGLDKKNVASICAAKWPKLEKLELWFGSKSYGANTTLKDVAPLLEGKAFPALKRLGLRNCEFTDEICGVLKDSKLLKRIEVLDLSKGVMTEVGAKALAASKASFAHLTRLDVSDNYLAGPSEKLIGNIAQAVRTKPQRKPSEYDGEQHRYVALGE